MKLNMYAIVLTALFFIYSCSGTINPLSDDARTKQAEAEIKAAIAHSPFFSDKGQEDSSDTDAGSSIIPPIPGYINFKFQGWYRNFDWESIERTITIDNIDFENNTAEVKINSSIKGHLKVANNWFQVLIGNITAEKAFTHYIQKKAVFEKTEEGWKVQKIAAVYSSSYTVDQNPAINIKNVKVQNTDTGAILINITDTDTLYNRDSLPHLAPNDPITVTVTVEGNTTANTNYCYLHHHLFFRDPMYDDGTSGDTTPNDNIYTRQYQVGNNKGIYIAFFDILSQATLSITNNNTYQSVIWGIPYIVE